MRTPRGWLPKKMCKWIWLLFDRNILPGPKSFCFWLDFGKFSKKTFELETANPTIEGD
jgi:hypothetical protein